MSFASVLVAGNPSKWSYASGRRLTNTPLARADLPAPCYRPWPAARPLA